MALLPAQSLPVSVLDLVRQKTGRLFFPVMAAGGAFFLLLCLSFFFSSTLFAGILFRSLMTRAGFPAAHFAQADCGLGGATFHSVVLDSDSFSTAAELTATYSLPGLLFGGHIRTLSIQTVVLTGEWMSGPFPSIAGWLSDPGGSSALSAPSSLPFDSLTIENLRLDLATQQGGITLQANASLSATPDGGASFQAAVEGKQYQLSLKAGVSGKSAPDGTWSVEANIENGRVNLDSFRFSRIDGWISANGGPGAPEPRLSGQLTAGKLSAGWIQMQALNAVIDGTPDDPHLVLNGTAAGVPGLGLAVELRNSALTATLSAAQKSDLQTYLNLTAKSLNRPPLPVQDLPKAFSALEFRLAHAPAPKDQGNLARYTLSVSDASQSLKIYSDLMWDGSVLAGTVETGPMAAGIIGPLFPAFLPEGWRLTGGTSSVQGQVTASWDVNGLRLDGPLKISLEKVDLDSDMAKVSGLSGTLVFDSLTPLATTGLQTLTAAKTDIGLPLKDVRAQFKIDPSGSLSIQSAQAHFAEGLLEAGAFQICDNAFENAPVRLTDIDLASAVKAFRSKDLALSGTLDGQMILSRKQTGPVMAQGRIEARSPGGLVRYKPNPVPAFLAGDDSGLATARLALENLRYDALSVDFKGPLDGDMETHLIARGANENAFGNRPIELNLNLQGAVLPLFRLAQ